MKRKHILFLFILFTGILFSLKSNHRVYAACSGSITRPAGTCTYNVTSCSIDLSGTETYDCASSESSSTNNATFVVGASTILTFQNSSTLNVGSISVTTGGSISQPVGARTINVGGVGGSAPLWVGDADADGFATNYDTTYTATAAGRRRKYFMRGISNDCNDNAYSTTNTCYAYGQGYYQAYYYGYGQGYYQAYYYGYGQGYYYGYGQGYYYGYSQSAYYGYGQSWYYGYGQSAYYCFLADTDILMADGSRKAIKDVQVGDMVQSYDTATGSFKADRVVAHIIHPQVNGTYLTVNGNLHVTANHPVYINGNWQDMGNAKVGDTLINDAGKTVTITSITESEPGTHDLYNLHLAGEDHNYFAEGVLVHNK